MGISEDRVTPVLSNWKCFLIAAAMSLANCQYGYDAAAVGGFQAMIGFLKVFGYQDPKAKIGWSIATQPQQLIASCLNIGTILGLLFTTLWSHYLGRRPAIWAGSAILAIAIAIQLGTTSLAALCIGRVILGIGNGFYFTFCNIYTVETAPPHLRAVLGSLFGIWTNLGALLGSVANNFSKNYTDRRAYQIPLASLYALPVILTFFMFLIPESPRWLLVQGRSEEAEAALAALRGNSLKQEYLREEFVEMERGIEEEKHIAGTTAFTDIFKGANLRRTIIVVGVVLSHSSCGIWLFVAYGTYFLQMGGVDDPFKIQIILILMGLIGTVLGMYLMYKHFGRRTMMLIGVGLSALFMLAAAISYSTSSGRGAGGKLIVVFVSLFVFSNNAFSGALSWPLAAELVSSRLRVHTFSFATIINYFFAWLISYCTPFFINPAALGWGGKYCYIWAASNAVTFVFFWFLLPEIKGRTLEEIDELFQNRVALKDFPKYQCQSSERAKQIAKDEGKVHEERVETVEKV